MTYEEIICDANNLYKAYKASVKCSKWKESTQRFMMNFLNYIFDIQEDLSNRTLTNGPVKEFSISERGRLRSITSITPSDRIVRHVLCDEVLIPAVEKKLIYDNSASIKGRGISHQRERFEVHLQKYYRKYGNEGYILFGDFTKFYDNIIHELAKKELLRLFDNDEFIDWLLTLIFDSFKVDVSYMSDDEYSSCLYDTFNKLDYRKIPKNLLTGEKWMAKSVNIGDQLSQVIGIYYPYRLEDLLKNIRKIAFDYGIHVNEKKTRIVKISSTYKFLQVKYTLTDSGKIIRRINPERVTAMRRKLKKMSVKVKTGEIPEEYLENMFRSWMGAFYKIMSKQQRKNLILLYEDLLNKNITIINKKLIISDK